MTTVTGRRGLILGLGAAAVSLTLPEIVRAETSAVDAKALFARARGELGRLGAAIQHRDVVGVCDFSVASKTPRFHILDMQGGKVTTLLVAHGRGSDPDHSGWVERFSNDMGSNASSSGAYQTGGYYTGKHGRSMRLKGLDRTNSNAEARAVVVHGAAYVSPAIAKTQGKLGRSQGCFAFSQADLGQVLTRLGPGRLLLAAKI
jgi:hypothetical protein